jgi:hypothetical protein
VIRVLLADDEAMVRAWSGLTARPLQRGDHDIGRDTPQKRHQPRRESRSSARTRGSWWRSAACGADGALSLIMITTAALTSDQA